MNDPSARMTDRTTRDQIELRERMASIVAFAGGSVRTRAQDRAAVDALIKAGLVVPAGLTAEKLRDAAERLDDGAAAMADGRNGIGAANAAVAARRLRGWAKALGEG